MWVEGFFTLLDCVQKARNYTGQAFELDGRGLARPNALHDFVVGGEGLEVVHGLEVEPGDGVAAEIAGESLGSVGRDGTAFVDNFVDAGRRDA